MRVRFECAYVPLKLSADGGRARETGANAAERAARAVRRGERVLPVREEPRRQDGLSHCLYQSLRSVCL